jgi:hypothetical protein
MVALVTAGGCTKKNNLFADGGTTSFSVGGTLDGLPSTGTVTLQLNGGDTLVLSDNGAFQFAGLLDTDANYVVTVSESPADAECTVGNDAGTIAAANVTDVSVSCVSSNADLSDLTISSIDAFAPVFASATTAYTLDVSLLVQELRLTATAVDPNATIEINGTSADSGLESSPLTLPLGTSTVSVVVTSSAGTTKTYALGATRGTKTMEQYAYGKASNTASQANFGMGIALSGDTMVVGAPRDKGDSSGINGSQAPGPNDTGAVYVFRRSGAVWAQEAYIKASNPNDEDSFGVGLALDSDTLVVGAYEEDSSAPGVNGNQNNNTLSGAGAAYVFRRSGTTWTQEAYLKASIPGEFDDFGRALALQGDTLVVGAPGEDSNSSGIDQSEDNASAQNSGAVYIFERTGTTWQQAHYIKASNTTASDEFGASLALTENKLVIGARNEDSDATTVNGDQLNEDASGSGAIYVFRRSGASWIQEAYLKATDSVAGTQLGAPLVMSGDTIAAGAIELDTLQGAVYVFRSDGATWQQEQRFAAPTQAVFSLYGAGIGLAGDTLAVGQLGESSGTTGIDTGGNGSGADASGAVFVYTRTGSTWAQSAFVKSSNSAFNDNFSYSVALSGDTLAVCARGEDSSASGFGGNQDDNGTSDSGAVYVFR